MDEKRLLPPFLGGAVEQAVERGHDLLILPQKGLSSTENFDARIGLLRKVRELKTESAPTSADRRRTLLICALLLAGIGLVYGHVLRCDFVAWDDDINVLQNPYLNPATWSSLIFFWKAPYLRLYIPLTYSVWTAAAWFVRWRAGAAAPLSAHLFHALNLLCQMVSGLCVFALLRALIRGPFSWRPAEAPSDGVRNDWAAALGAAVFAFHPLQVEPVAWISGLRDMISGLATVGALWQYVVFAAATDRRRARAHYAAATILFACALLSKPSAVVIPALAALLDYGWLGRPFSRCARSLAFWFAAAGVFALLTQTSQGATHIRALMPLWSRPLVALDSLAFYLSKLVWPRVLSPDYGRAPDLALARGWLYYTWLAPAALALLIGFCPGRRINAVCAGLFALAPFPVLGLVPFLHQDLSTVADRYVYVSLLGPAAAVAWYLSSRPESAGGASMKRWPWAAAGLLVLVLGARSWAQTRIWTDTGTLFGHIVAYNPESGIAHMNLGNYLLNQGELKDAEFHLREALRLRPGEGLPLNNLGNLMVREGKTAEAIGYYERALRDGVPDNVVDAHNALGIVLSEQGKTAEAERHFLAALTINPNRERIHNNFGLLLAKEGKLDGAANEYQVALQIRPEFPEARRNLAQTWALLGRLGDARREMARALGRGEDSVEADSALADYLQVHGDFAKALPFYQEIVKKVPAMAEARNSLGFTLAKVGRQGEALEQYAEAARLNPRFIPAQFNLGASLLQAGKLDAAVAALSRAVDANPNAVELRYNLGVALLKSGKRADAILKFQEAARLRPDFEPSRKILEDLSRPGGR
jgi:tetratricopeptide (TPR) repeat protein